MTVHLVIVLTRVLPGVVLAGDALAGLAVRLDRLLLNVLADDPVLLLTLLGVAELLGNLG